MKSLLYTTVIVFSFSIIVIAQSAGNAIEFDGLDDYMLVPHHQSLNPVDGSWTICLWINAPDMIQEGPLVRKRLPMEGYTQYNLLIGDTDPHHPSPGKRLIYNYIDSSGYSERSGHLQDEFVDGNWHHIAVVSDKSADSVLIFIDGNKQSFIMQFNFGIWPTVENLDSVLVGRDTNGNDFYTGEMDELSIWNKALSNAQINSVMSDTLSPSYYLTSDSGLVGYWRFDRFEDLGIGNGINDIRDFSVWGNHGGTEGLPTLVPSGILLDVKDSEGLPQEFLLAQNYPNPFNPSTKIKFTVSQSPLLGGDGRDGLVTLKVYDVLGNEVATLVDEYKPAGSYEVEFNSRNLINQVPTSGVYFYQLRAGSFIQTKKMILIK